MQQKLVLFHFPLFLFGNHINFRIEMLILDMACMYVANLNQIDEVFVTYVDFGVIFEFGGI